jgi:membrane-associated PAP2 superfamily phosphatase
MPHCISPGQIDPPPERRRGALIVFILLLLILTVAMLAIIKRDYAWTMAISSHRIKWFSDLMGRTLFEGQRPGGPDVATLFIAISFILYLLAWLRPQWARLVRLRPYLGFIVSSGFICAIFMVHCLKFAVGRARPSELIRKGLPYTHFFQLGPHYVTQGVFRGSFPSGHTADVFSLMTLAYILAIGGPRRSSAMRLSGVAWGVLVLAYSVLMGVARCMSLSHWVGDCLFSILMSWPIMHALYFWVLRVPEQTAVAGAPRSPSPMPFMWEFRLCWWLWWITVGLLATVVGCRAFQEEPVPWLGFLIPSGLLLIFWAARRLQKFYYGRVREGFPPPPPSPAARAS